jgi:predicted kinase
MEAVILIGVQASGKTTFYRERFFNTHVRISLDLLKTRHREMRFMQVCLETQQPFVIDNTNPTREERRRYNEAAKAARFRVVGYYLQSSVEGCKARNEGRCENQQIPLVGLLGTYKRLELPSLSEGFDELYYVRIGDDGGFVIERWSDEV